MPATLSLYSFKDENDNEQDYQTHDYDEAARYAQENGLLIVDNVYEWSEAVPLKDFRPGADDDDDEDDESEPADATARIQDAYAKMDDPIHVMDHDHTMDH